MKRAMKIMIVVFLALALLLAGFVVFAVTTGFSFSTSGMAPLVNTQRVGAASVETLSVSYASESITLVKTSGNEIVLEEYMSRHTDEMLASVDQSGSTLSIRSGQRNWIMNMWYGYAVVYIPADWSGTLQVQSSSGSVRSDDDWDMVSISLQSTSGSVRVQGLTAVNGVSLKSSSGSVRVGDVVAGGQVKLQSTSASVHAGSITAERVEGSSSSGSVNVEAVYAPYTSLISKSASVRLGHVEGEYYLESSSGSVKLESGSGHGTAASKSASVNVSLEDVTGDLVLSSTSGSVRLALPRAASFTFNGRTSSGSLRTEFDDALSFNSKGNEASGTVGENPAFHVECSSSSASVRISYT